LPTLSNNGITGTWNPATISTAAAGTTTYTFTPDAGQCATATTTVDVTVTGAVTPTFDPIGNLCIGATAPVLPALSNNGINGTWNPATISTAAAGTTTYTFTPDAGQCASSASIDITIAAQVTPVFTAIGPLCVGATAPICQLLSNNGITGTWNPATISTAAAGTTTYTFTPDAGQCATATTTVDVTITGAVTPTFDPLVILHRCNSSGITCSI
jgi:RNA 3'-terminal phosphate cyclase